MTSRHFDAAQRHTSRSRRREVFPVLPRLSRRARHGTRSGVRLLLLAAALCLSPVGAFARVDGDTIVLGAAVSLTGRYTTAGHHTRNGYDLALKMINERGGVRVAGKDYRLQVLYYDDESTPARGAQLAERLIRQDGCGSCSARTARG